MFCYKIYGKYVMINVKLPLLCDVSEAINCDLKVYVEFDTIIGDTVKIKDDFNKYIIELGSLAHYCVDPINNTITCTASNLEAFFSTFFNIPFSVYSLCKNEILYHACSLSYDNQVFCLTGNKGVGKSTIMQLFSSDNKFKIFGDDTIHIDSRAICNSAHNLVKQTSETVEALKLKTLKIKNAAGKFYSYFDMPLSSSKINKIFHLVRRDSSEFHLKPINTLLIKNSIFRTNIVGIAHMPHSLISKTIKAIPNPNIDFYDLSAPDNLEYLINNRDNLKNLITNCFKG